MKTVCLKYPGGKLKLDKKFKVAASTKGSVFRSYIAKELPQFYDIEYFMLMERKGQITILDESKTFASLSEEKKMIIHLVYLKSDVTVKVSQDQQRKLSISLKENVGTNISESINLPNSELFTFAFRPTDDPSYYRIVCKNLPLVYQDWFGEQLFLIRRVLPKETENVEDLFNECVFSSRLGLTIMSSKDWIDAGICRLLGEGNEPRSINKKSLIEVIPNSIRVDENLFKCARAILEQNAAMSKEEAMTRYVQISTLNGGQCSYIDKVQFLVMDGKWRMNSTRYLYVSPVTLTIAKEIGTEINHRVLISSISEYHIEEEFIIISFKDQQSKWRIKSLTNKKILKNILDEVVELLSKDEANIIQSDFHASSPSLEVSEQEQQEAAPVIESQDASFDDSIDISHYNKIPTNQRIGIDMVSNGLSQLIIPKPEEKDQPFNLSPYISRDLSCVQMVQIPEKKEEKEEEEDSLEKETSILDKVPYINKLNIPQTSKGFLLFTLVFLAIFITKDIL